MGERLDDLRHIYHRIVPSQVQLPLLEASMHGLAVRAQAEPVDAAMSDGDFVLARFPDEGGVAVDALGGQVALCGNGAADNAAQTGAAPGRGSSAHLFDEVLELLWETGNLGLDFVAGYLLSYCEGILSNRQRYPARHAEAESWSASADSGENS